MATPTNGNGTTEKICTLTLGVLIEGESIEDGEMSIEEGHGFSELKPEGDVPPPQDPPKLN